MGRGPVWGGGQWTVTKKIYISISGSVSYMKSSYSDIGVQSAVMHSCVLKRAKGFVSACEKESVISLPLLRENRTTNLWEHVPAL